MDDVQQLIREYREHYQRHQDPMCERCELWVAYREADDKTLDALAGSDNEEVADAAQAIRAHLGEGGWTDKESE